MPVFSLPGGHGVGDFGPAAFRFVDFLQAAGQTIWQLLPLVPTSLGNSPYSSYSAFAGNQLLISMDKLVELGLLNADQVSENIPPNTNTADYNAAREYKEPLLRTAFANFRNSSDAALASRFMEFLGANRFWLTDFARFEAHALSCGHKDWARWDEALVRRDATALSELDSRLADEIHFAKFQQFVFDIQWRELKQYANERNIRIYGDMPIFVAYESVDVWTNQNLFSLNEAGRPTVVAGVPPDYFSETGQMWGNPLYNWEQLAATNYEWWTLRIRYAFQNFDLLRIDHFRGFESYWEIPADAPNAISGQWKPGPRRGVFDAARESLGELPIVAEDLGLITDEVHGLRDELGLPGMRVLQFGFAHEHDNYHRPEAYPEHSVAYTGTHDNDTIVGWHNAGHDNEAQRHILGRFLSGDPARVHTELIAAVMHSAAETAIIPMQDLLGLGTEARTNTPGEADGNWLWRCSAAAFNDQLASEFRQLTQDANRLSEA